MTFWINFIIIAITITAIALLLSIEKKQNEKVIYTRRGTNYQEAKKKLNQYNKKKFNPYTIIALSVFALMIVNSKFLNQEEPIEENNQAINTNEQTKEAPRETQEEKQNIEENTILNEPSKQKVIYRKPTTEEEKAYLEEHHLIKLGNEYHWCGIKENKEILPITKALDMDCKNDLCRIQKYYDYVKKIPYERGTRGKDKNAVEVMQEWKGDCDERSDLLASMMLANGYKTILLYTKDHTLTALNIPRYETNENRAYIQYQGEKYYIAETTDPNGQIGGYNKEVMNNIRFIYDVNNKKNIAYYEASIHLFNY